MDQDDKKHVENKEFKDLMTLQHNVKVQPELYTADTVKAVNVFKEEYNKVKNNPGPKNERFNHYCSFLAHVSDIFKKDLSFLPTFLYELLLNYGTILHPHIRMKCVQCIIMMRNKEVIPPIEALNIFFKLLTIKDKEMRKLIIAHIINDIKRMNVQRKNLPVNKQVQNYIFDIIKNNHDVLAKRAIFIIISLYRKQVWNDAKAVNVISSGCFNENDKVVLMACNFLIQTTEETYESDSEDEEEAPAQGHNKKSKVVGKKTKAKEMQKEREMKRLKRKEKRKSKIQLMKNFFPIDMINNPQDFCDKLFNHLKKKNHKFEVKLAIMSVLGRMIGRHSLIVMNFYPYMIKYLMPHQREIGKILAYVSESCHELIPPDDLQVVLKHLVENFANERATEEKMTMGFHTIKEMCERSPLMMDEFHLNYLAEYKTYKEKNVATAARALINYFRDVNPDLLDKKHRGRFDMLDKKENRKTYMYGEAKICERVDGADLLKARSGIPAECDRILTDDDFRMIKVLKKRKLEEEADKLNNLNQYTRAKKSENDDDEDYEDVDDDEEIEGLEGEADEDDDEDLEEMEEDDLEIVDGEEVDGEDGDDDEEEIEEGEDEEEGEGKKKPAVKKNNKAAKTEKKGDEDKDKVEQWELDELTDSDEDENPNNFVSVDSLTKFKKRKKQRLIEEKEKEKVKEKKDWTPKYMKNRQGSAKGIKNYEKEKNKNLLMLRPKKNRQRDDLKNLKSNINSMRRQLGHVRNKKEARSKMVKYQRKFK